MEGNVKRINIGRANSMDRGDTEMDKRELKNSILFQCIEFEVSETDSYITTPGARHLTQKKNDKCIQRFVGKMHTSDISI